MSTESREDMASELSHWDCWGWCGNRTVSRPEPEGIPKPNV